MALATVNVITEDDFLSLYYVHVEKVSYNPKALATAQHWNFIVAPSKV